MAANDFSLGSVDNIQVSYSSGNFPGGYGPPIDIFVAYSGFNSSGPPVDLIIAYSGLNSSGPPIDFVTSYSGLNSSGPPIDVELSGAFSALRLFGRIIHYSRVSKIKSNSLFIQGTMKHPLSSGVFTGYGIRAGITEHISSGIVSQINSHEYHLNSNASGQIELSLPISQSQGIVFSFVKSSNNNFTVNTQGADRIVAGTGIAISGVILNGLSSTLKVYDNGDGDWIALESKNITIL